MLIDMGHGTMISVCVCVGETVWRHVTSHCQDRPFLSPVHLERLAVTQSSVSARRGLVLNWFPHSGLAWDQALRRL